MKILPLILALLLTSCYNDNDGIPNPLEGCYFTASVKLSSTGKSWAGLVTYNDWKKGNLGSEYITYYEATNPDYIVAFNKWVCDLNELK